MAQTNNDKAQKGNEMMRRDSDMEARNFTCIEYSPELKARFEEVIP